VATTLHPVLVLPTIFVTHYLEDWIPHWDVGTGLSSGKRKRQTAIVLELGELGISTLLVYFFFQSGHENIVWSAWLGAFVGLIPDFLEAPRNFLHWEPKLIRPLNNLHQTFHHSTPNILIGMAPQLVLWWIIWWLR